MGIEPNRTQPELTKQKKYVEPEPNPRTGRTQTELELCGLRSSRFLVTVETFANLLLFFILHVRCYGHLQLSNQHTKRYWRQNP